MTEAGVPRRSLEPNPEGQLMAMIRRLRQDVDALQRGSTLRDASISGGEGLSVLDEDGNTVLRLSTTDGGGVVAYELDGTEAARFGPLLHTDPGEYGVEVNAGDAWVRLGYQSTSWTQVAGRPGTTGGATIPGTFITGTVPAATVSGSTTGNAATADHADLADGSQYGFNNTVSGTEFYALWVGNDGGFHFGRNVSSRKYKENITDSPDDPLRALKARPVRYDRKPTYEVLPPGVEGPVRQYPGAKGEFGLIAEEVHEWAPEIVTRHDGEIDGVRYELFGVVLVPVVQNHEDRISKLEALVRDQAARIAALEKTNGVTS